MTKTTHLFRPTMKMTKAELLSHWQNIPVDFRGEGIDFIQKLAKPELFDQVSIAARAWCRAVEESRGDKAKSTLKPSALTVKLTGRKRPMTEAEREENERRRAITNSVFDTFPPLEPLC